jgi:hypothetical protein
VVSGLLPMHRHDKPGLQLTWVCGVREFSRTTFGRFLLRHDRILSLLG